MSGQWDILFPLEPNSKWKAVIQREYIGQYLQATRFSESKKPVYLNGDFLLADFNQSVWGDINTCNSSVGPEINISSIEYITKTYSKTWGYGKSSHKHWWQMTEELFSQREDKESALQAIPCKCKLILIFLHREIDEKDMGQVYNNILISGTCCWLFLNGDDIWQSRGQGQNLLHSACVGLQLAMMP